MRLSMSQVRSHKFRYLWMSLLIVLITACTAPAAPATEAPAAEGGETTESAASGPTGTIIAAQPASVAQMDPQITQLSSERSTHDALFDSLLDTDKDMVPIPRLATAWESEDDTTWLLTLRDDVTFHNGEPFNAETVKFNVERVLREGFQRFAFLQFLESAEVVDDTTVRIKTKTPFPQFLNRMSQFYMVPKAYLEEVGDEEFNLNPVGTGAWKFVEWVPDSHVTLEANEEYWGEVPKAKTLIWRTIPDEATRMSALLAGEVDHIRGLSPDQFDQVDADANLAATSVESLRTPFFFLYPDSPSGGGEPLADVRVRQALNYAVNTQAIIDALLGGRASRTATLMIPKLRCYDASIEPYPYDPEKAKELLAEAGYPDGFTIDMEAWSNGPSPKPVETAQAVAADLAAVGITVNLTTPEQQTMLVKQRERAFPPITMWSYGGGAADPDDKFWSPYSVEATNHLLYTDEMQELIAQGRTLISDEDRCPIYQRLQQIVKDEAIILPLYAQHDLYGARADLDWEVWPDERVSFNNAVATRE